MEHIECELKLKIIGNITEILKNYGKKAKIIKQIYFNLKDEYTREHIKNFLPRNFDFSKYAEARVRIINNKFVFLTLKSHGYLERLEFEKQIPISFLKNLDKLSIKGLINKARYDIILDEELEISIDKYLDLDLCVMEVEFDKNIISRAKIIKKIKNLFKKIEFEDITDNLNYKNSNLAKQE